MFVLSKIFWIVASPVNIFVGALIVGTALLFTRYRRTGRALVALAVIFVVAVGVFPVGDRLIESLENRFPANLALPDDVAGIIVLGGTVNQHLTAARGQPALTAGAERLTEFVHLAHRFPGARLVFSGGSGAIFDRELKESTVAEMFFSRMNLDKSRVVYESEARNTLENATLTRALVDPGPDEKWVLITSAMHMPRAMGTFRAAGWNVIAYPVDFYTDGKWSFNIGFAPLTGLSRLDIGLHEWIGLAAYRVLGRTETFFPGPGTATDN